MSSSGGGQSGTTQYNWNPVMEGYYAGNASFPGGFLGLAANETQKPYQAYPYATVAGIDPYQQSAMEGIYNTVYGGGAADTEAGREAARQFASGGNDNPYGGLNNPYYQQVVNQGMQDITNNYNQATGDITKRFNSPGSWGGSAHALTQEGANKTLAQQLGNYANQMYSQQYDRAGSMASEDLSRQLQSIPLAQQGQNLSFDAFRTLMGAGDFNRSVTQQNYDDSYRRWAEEQNYWRNNLDWMFNTLGRAQGSTGTTINTPGYGGLNPAAGLLGAAALYGGLKT